ncbi:hypothetical protein ACLB2K_068400 [Fragaria x ananassa]
MIRTKVLEHLTHTWDCQLLYSAICLDSDMGREKRMSSRRNFFQYFENEESADHIEKFPIPENTSTENANIIGRWRESTRSSRKRSFQNLEDEGTSAAPDIFEEQNNVIGVQTVDKQVNVHEKDS